MKTRQLGTTGLAVTEYSFGGASLGNLYNVVARDEAMKALDAAWSSGMRYFDTAPHYGFGLSERRFGDYLRDKPRASYILSTKVGRLLKPVPEDQVPNLGFVEPLPFKLDYDYSYDGIMRSVEFSYARLGLNRIDILYVHDIGVYTHGVELTKMHLRQLLDGGLRALDQLKSSGAISAYGLGVNEVQVCLDVMRRAPLDCILLAGRYTLLDRTAEEELIPLCQERKTSLVVGGVFNSGILATGPVAGAHFDYGAATPEILGKVGEMTNIAAAGGYPLAKAALEFPLHQEVVSSVLIGTAKASSLTRNMSLLGDAVPVAEFDKYCRHTILQQPPTGAVRE